MCGTSADCTAWQDCGAGNLCTLAPGRCVLGSDCSPWQYCDASHTCTLYPNGCADDAGCAAWQTCASYRCAPAPGFCADDSGCQTWQACGTDHLCATRPGNCAGDVDCATWQACGASHTCRTRPGFCAGDPDCAAWQACGTDHLCATRPGNCAGDVDCASWQACGTSHTCGTRPGFCAGDPDCAAWQACGTDHLCATKPGFCGNNGDCGAGDRCNGAHACEADPCQHLPPACTGTTSGFHVVGGPGAVFDGEVVVTTKFDASVWSAQCTGYVTAASLAEDAYVNAYLSRDPSRPDSFSFMFGNGHYGLGGLATGSYATGASSSAGMHVDTFSSTYHSASCTHGAGTFEVCRVQYGPKFGSNEVELLELTASFQETCDEAPGVWSGCVHYVVGSEPGAFGPAGAIASGWTQLCGVGSGWLRCWGWSQESEQAPDLMWPTADLAQLSMGGGHGCATTSAGGVICWGYNDVGQAGGGSSLPDVWSPIMVLTTSVASVWPTGEVTYAVLDDGRIKFWGRDELLNASYVPADAFTPGQYVAFSGGDRFACGLTPAGGVQCWGNYDKGQLGDGTISSLGKKGPVDVTGLATGVVKISSQTASTCALQAGAVKCWGDNGAGQLGDGTKTTQPSPVGVALGGVATDVALTRTHACAVVDGGVKCWGMNRNGCLGDGTTTDRPTPDWAGGYVAGSGAVQVAVTDTNSCVLFSDHTIWCWGGGYGNGDGLGHDTYVPVKVRW
jgi:alpha-tubulin suppressor-like RCC1 family protein